ncbi:uncharacterized protein LOC132201263 [Neocloeon triangulifer]|uniref:uncharacterized protein LOC132201263 n=1 Tax=Neocloeon triangulifer TaxID=2078957 RepID=UPI00286F2478|nr:uncharacterized protein LOC132201263 [Neocloeon triangulifer]
MPFPSSFFLVLDSRQAAVAVAFMKLFIHVPLAFLVRFIFSLTAKMPRIRDLDETKLHMLVRILHFLNWTFAAEISIIMLTLLMLYGTIKRIWWFSIPWLILCPIELIFKFLLYADLVDSLNETFKAYTNWAALLFCTLAFVLMIGIQMYEFLAVFCSMREIAMENRSTRNRGISTVL